MHDYLQGLNERQREAVLHKDGPIMIVAGAGSGKTKVLTTRIAHLMASGVDAFNILALTFTNKAAKEMKERIEKILGNSEARNLYIGTFHSVFARILRSEATRIGYPSNFTIYDTDDAKGVIKTVINELHLDDKQYKPNIVYNRISSAKNALVTAREYAESPALMQEDMRANRPAIAQIYDAYVKRCFKNGAMDFDDLLLKFYELLRDVPDARNKYQEKFRYILIDEYQDTNPAQYEVIKILGSRYENVCVVGDDAQSIYSFRGATIQNILQFQKDYDDVKVVMLEQNYRSSKTILNVANEVISNNKGQIEKKLFTDNGQGEKIRLVRTMTDNEEGKYVADTIQEQKLRNHYANKDFAILYRTNAQSRAFEESLRKMGIPYIMYGGLSFYQRKEVKDMVAYLRLLVNHRDEEALKRIINYPVRGIGKTTIDKTLLLANEQDISMWEVLENAAQLGFRSGTLEAIENFVTMIKSFASMLQTKNAYEVAFHVGKQTNLVKELFNDKSTEGVARYENIQELMNSIKEWVESPDNEDGEVVDKSLGSYLQQITLLTDADNKDPNSDSVKLMTIHAAKGLEFSCVFAAGLEESLFPNAMSINSREELEEERRLFYVVITRAKERLWISYANQRYKFGSLIQNEPSRFIEELPDEFVDRSFAGGGSRNSGFSTSAFDRMNGGGWGKSSSAQAEKQYGPPPSRKKDTPPPYLGPKPVVQKVVEHKPSEDFVPTDTSNLQVGQRVEHQKFGFGEVVKMEGASHNPIATVKFEHNGEKKIMLNYAKLRVLEQ
ncbi:MAG: UvrD-helicase domain-containing protein [Terrimonas ferruginea]|mgnify:CR=1 FL=1|uniref:ATP-dependent helicase n=1 Tax=Terrimonas ferruginea TaxID=249 RepID=UPI00092AB944|nr:UvrD-helicase domain-containing protein [Terrimonas ferruginea]MBN8783461.1 UvrD-helicase domain-containing protein [Terrimonas ferruginea]OJW40224.1 MAG: ATP-dependent DNA helicase [Sphingobacteriales bacterium 48-107]